MENKLRRLGMKTPTCCGILFFSVGAMATMTRAQNLNAQTKPAPQKITAQSSVSVPTSFSPDFDIANEMDKGCEYLRVYRVRRPYVNSDVTVPSGYTVCVPSWKTNLRSAVETRSGPVIDKVGK
jgi:hypothetical protein